MKTSENGLNLIKHFEGLRLKPYQCSANKWTIGYGTTYYEDMTPVAQNDLPITDKRAEHLLKYNLLKFETRFNKRIQEIGLELTQNEYDACICFLYNLGLGMLSIERSFGKALKSKDKQAIADSFLLYCKANGIILEGLKKRREAERELFLRR